MQSPVRSPLSNHASHPLPILRSRQEYRSCHVRLPGSSERVAAIAHNGQYYSFFRVEKTEDRAREIGDRLLRKGHTVLLTQTPKAYAVWILEPEAEVASISATAGTHVATPKLATALRVLNSPTQYQPCYIRVPDLEKRLVAICYQSQYYSLFKVLDDLPQALELINRLRYRGDETVITHTAKGFALWILEPDATLD